MEGRTIIEDSQEQKSVSIEKLRQMKDYEIANSGQEHLFIGRDKETRPYKVTFAGRILHPEARGEEWTLEKNQAFMAGAIDAGRKFLVVTDMQEIADRAKRGVKGQCAQGIKLGYATAEILWLQDNGYTFEAAEGGKTWAVPPAEKAPCKIVEYGHTDQKNTLEQVDRICKIADQVSPSPVQQRRGNQDVARYRPPSLRSWGESSSASVGVRRQPDDNWRNKSAVRSSEDDSRRVVSDSRRFSSSSSSNSRYRSAGFFEDWRKRKTSDQSTPSVTPQAGPKGN